MPEETEKPSLDDLLQQYIGQENLRFEGDSGLDNLNKIARLLGHKESGFKYGSPLEQLLSDSPALQDAIIEAIGNLNVPEWREALEAELPGEEWRVYGRTKNYVYWVRSSDGETVYNATTDDKTPPGEDDGGYGYLLSLRKLKGDLDGRLEEE